MIFLQIIHVLYLLIVKINNMKTRTLPTRQFILYSILLKIFPDLRKIFLFKLFIFSTSICKEIYIDF